MLRDTARWFTSDTAGTATVCAQNHSKPGNHNGLLALSIDIGARDAQGETS